jgi:hypothetical protein
MSAFPPAVTGYRRTRPTTQLRTQPPPTLDERHPLKKFHSIKTNFDVAPKAEAYMQNYGDAHRRKVIQIHRDWEEFYMRPLHGRMRSRLNGRRYGDFTEGRTRTLSDLEARAGGPPSGLGSGPVYGALGDEEAVELPYVRIPTDGLKDRIHKYRHHVQKEETLRKYVREIDGNTFEEVKTPERVTFETEAWKRLEDVRAFGVDSPTGLRKGRRPFAEILHSQIDEAMGHF